MQYLRRATREHFRKVIPRLEASGFSVLAVDPRAIGGNPGSLAGITYHELAADVARAIHAQARGPVHVVATAAAALVARCLAQDAPELVRSLVLTGPGAVGEPFPRQPDPAALATYRKIFFGPAFDSEERRQAIQDAGYSPASGARAE
jgi:pimeloyl-ACP methyl ester carboxylesterase